MEYNTIIIGAGAAGLMSANQLENKNFLILEKTNYPGQKLLLTGNKRCNLTNLKTPKEFISNIQYNQKFLYSTINNYTPQDIYNYFNEYIPLKEESNNKIFPKSDKSTDILNVLLKNIEEKIIYNEEVLSISPINNLINIKTNNNEYITKNLIVATGGTSFKQTGSTGDIIKFAKSLEIETIPFFAAETGIILEEKIDLAGNSIDLVEINIDKIKTSGPLIYTHTGLSGESIMNISGYINCNKIKEITIDLLPSKNIENIKQELELNREKELVTYLKKYYSTKISNQLINEIKLTNRIIKTLTHKEIESFINNIKAHKYKILKTNSIESAYVCGGGVKLNEVNTKTFQTLKYPNIYIVGEALDIYGPIGGYNLTLAFSTATNAALSINKM